MHHLHQRHPGKQNRRILPHLGADRMLQKRGSDPAEWEVDQRKPSAAVQELDPPEELGR